MSRRTSWCIPAADCSVKYPARSGPEMPAGQSSVVGWARCHHSLNVEKCLSYLFGYPFLESFHRFLNTAFAMPWRAPCSQINRIRSEATSPASNGDPTGPLLTTTRSEEGLGVPVAFARVSETTFETSILAELPRNEDSNRTATSGEPAPLVSGGGKRTELPGSSSCTGTHRRREPDGRDGN